MDRQMNMAEQKAALKYSENQDRKLTDLQEVHARTKSELERIYSGLRNAEKAGDAMQILAKYRALRRSIPNFPAS